MGGATRRGEIRARLEAATPGRWEAEAHKTRPNCLTVQADGAFLAHYISRAGDAVLIAHAADDMRWLLDALATAEQERDDAIGQACVVECVLGDRLVVEERADGWCGSCGRKLPAMTDRAPWAHSTCATTCRFPYGCMNPNCPNRQPAPTAPDRD